MVRTMNYLITPSFQSTLKLIKAVIYPEPHKEMTLWDEVLAVDTLLHYIWVLGFMLRGEV